MKIKLNHCEALGDWYTVIRAEHDGKEWWQETGPYSRRFMSSERLSPESCIEGNAYEMLEVAKAIKNRGAVSFERIAIYFESVGVYLYSPKNSERHAVVSREEADGLAEQIFEQIQLDKETVK